MSLRLMAFLTLLHPQLLTCLSIKKETVYKPLMPSHALLGHE